MIQNRKFILQKVSHLGFGLFHYGKVSGQTIEVMCLHDPEFQQEGREVIICLRMIEEQFRRSGTYYDAPPERSLDSREKAILEVIESGAHLTDPTVGTRW